MYNFLLYVLANLNVLLWTFTCTTLLYILQMPYPNISIITCVIIQTWHCSSWKRLLHGTEPHTRPKLVRGATLKKLFFKSCMFSNARDHLTVGHTMASILTRLYDASIRWDTPWSYNVDFVSTIKAIAILAYATIATAGVSLETRSYFIVSQQSFVQWMGASSQDS